MFALAWIAGLGTIYFCGGSIILGVWSRLSPPKKPVNTGLFCFALLLWPLMVALGILTGIYEWVSGQKFPDEKETKG
jgi:hypothetical protein